MIAHERENVIKNDEIDSASYKDALSRIELRLIQRDAQFIEFDLVNADCAVANALRRILISEVPTIAVDKVRVHKNTGVVPDEVLAHRLGLVPMCVDAGDVDAAALAFTLSVRNTARDTRCVFSDDIVCAAAPNTRWFKSRVPITKLAFGQEIELEITCAVGTGTQHAKWSPVCPATYRLMPQITIGDVYDEDAAKLASLFAAGVIGIARTGGRAKAFVENPRRDFVSREVLRHAEFAGRVALGRVPGHFIFTVETVSAEPVKLLRAAVAILVARADRLAKDILSRDDC